MQNAQKQTLRPTTGSFCRGSFFISSSLVLAFPTDFLKFLRVNCKCLDVRPPANNGAGTGMVPRSRGRPLSYLSLAHLDSPFKCSIIEFSHLIIFTAPGPHNPPLFWETN